MTEDSIINSEPTCDLFAVYATAKDVASAMAYIHSKDIIHGDLQGDALGLVSSSQDPRSFTAKVRSPPSIPFCTPPSLPQFCLLGTPDPAVWLIGFRLSVDSEAPPASLCLRGNQLALMPLD